MLVGIYVVRRRNVSGGCGSRRKCRSIEGFESTGEMKMGGGVPA